MNITAEFKQKVVAALKDVRTRYGGIDKDFARQWDINGSVWSRLKNGETDGLLKDNQWLNIGRNLNITTNERVWKMAKTEVFTAIKSDVEFCQMHSKSMSLVDDCDIGKSFTGRYLSKTLNNCFYLDASQCKTRSLFIRTLAKVIGVDSTGRLSDVKENTKYYLRMLTKPVVIIDEAGDFDSGVELEVKEYWNATEGCCGWYRMGAEGFRAKIERGISNKKVGYRENLRRYGGKFLKIVPVEKNEEQVFYSKLIGDVLSVNIKDKTRIPALIKKCLVRDEKGKIGGLTMAETLLILNDVA